MAQNQIYQKFGGFAAPDMDALVKGQAAVGSGIKDAIGGIRKLLTEQEETYRQENTLNMQEHLRSQLQSAGLGADPIDKVAIGKQFGDKVNMAALDETYSTEMGRLKDDATNAAASIGLDTLNQSQDPLAARKAFEDSLRKAGAKESFVTTATQQWSDSQATRFEDIAVQKERQNSRDDQFLAEELAENGAESGRDIMDLIIQQYPEDQQFAQRQRLDATYQKMIELTPEQLRKKAGVLTLAKTMKDQKILQATQRYEDKMQELAAVNTGIPDGAYQQVEAANTKLGASVGSNIKDRITNIFEGLSSTNDSAELIKAKNDIIARYNVPAKEADAMLAYAFGQRYGGDGWLFNDMSDTQVIDAVQDMEGMAQKYQQQAQISNEATDLKQQLATLTLQEERKIAELSESLHKGGQKRKIGVKDAPSIDELGQQFFSKMANTATPTPPKSDKKKSNKKKSVIQATLDRVKKNSQQPTPEKSVPPNLPTHNPFTQELLPGAQDRISKKQAEEAAWLQQQIKMQQNATPTF